MRRSVVVVTVLLCAATAGCGPAAGSSATSPSPTVSPAVGTPATTPAPPAPAQDAARIKRALVTAKDLGQPWIQPKTVPTVASKKGEICPGHVSATQPIAFTAQIKTDLTEGKGAGKNIATFSLRMLPAENDKALVAAYKKDQRACATYTDANGLFVVRTLEGPTSVSGGEVISSWAERLYFDQTHQRLAYARQSIVTREGRAVTYVSYAFLTTKQDPKAQDFVRVTGLLAVQLGKNAKALR